MELCCAEFTLAHSLSRYLVADEMRNQRLPAEAAKLIEPIVDLQALNPATHLYLGCLVEARRDEAFRAALAKASPEVRKDPETLWLLAIHSWNVGDLPESRRAVDALLANRPDSAPARLLKIEILIRSNEIDELLPELERPIESLAFSRLSDRLRVASLLGHFGQMDRAVAYAYRLFLENREISQAWLCFHGLVLRAGTKLAHLDEFVGSQDRLRKHGRRYRIRRRRKAIRHRRTGRQAPPPRRGFLGARPPADPADLWIVGRRAVQLSGDREAGHH